MHSKIASSLLADGRQVIREALQLFSFAFGSKLSVGVLDFRFEHHRAVKIKYSIMLVLYQNNVISGNKI